MFCLLRLLRSGWEQSSMVNLISLREVSCLLKRLWLGRWLASEEYSVLSQSTYYCLLIDFVLLCLPTKFLTLGWLYWYCGFITTTCSCACLLTWSSQSIKIGINILIKISKSDQSISRNWRHTCFVYQDFLFLLISSIYIIR